MVRAGAAVPVPAAHREQIAALPDLRTERQDKETSEGERSHPPRESADERRADWDALGQAVPDDRDENPRRILGVASRADVRPEAPEIREQPKSTDSQSENSQQPEARDDLPSAIREARDNPRDYAAGRAAEHQTMLPETRRGRITMGVGIGTDSDGGTRVVIGTSEDNGYLRKPLRLNDGEEIAEGKGHAETSILDHMAGRDIRPSHIAAGRPICPPCADRVDTAGAQPASPLKTEKENRP